MMVEFEKNARTLGNHANNDKPPLGGFFQNDQAVRFEREAEIHNSFRQSSKEVMIKINATKGMDMTLFEECKELLKADFDVVDGDDLIMVMDIFHEYPWYSGNLIWSEMDFSDYEITHGMFNGSELGNETVFVIADDADVPVFSTHLQLIFNNIYDVIAISPNLFIFNDNIMIKPLFPHNFVRFSLRCDEQK